MPKKDISDIISNEIDESIKEKTGLETKKAISAYGFFYTHSDFDTGLIMYGDVQRDFRELTRLKLKIGNNELNKLDEKTEEKITRGADRRYNFWLNYFIERGLIGKKFKFFQVGGAFPVLKGYNPFNDSGFYIPYKEKDEKKWNGRISRAYLTQEERQRREALGCIFKG